MIPKLLVINATKSLQTVLKKTYCDKIKCVKSNQVEESYNIRDYYILCTRMSDYKLYNFLPNNIFNNNLENITLLNNKSLFYKYMMEHFPDSIPPIYYYNHDDITYMKEPPQNEKMIFKPNTGYYGGGIKIIFDFNPNSGEVKNATVSKYIDHTTHYLGHFLVINGKILGKTYFKATNPLNYIKQSKMTNYTIHETIQHDDNIYDNIFKSLNFSGFVHTDFVINNNKLIIFEINPFPSTTFIKEKYYFNMFLDKILEFVGETNIPTKDTGTTLISSHKKPLPNTNMFDQKERPFTICANCNKKHYL